MDASVTHVVGAVRNDGAGEDQHVDADLLVAVLLRVVIFRFGALAHLEPDSPAVARDCTAAQ